MEKPFSQVLTSLLVCGRASLMGEKMTNFNLVLCTTTMGLQSLYLWLDPVEMVRMFTGIHSKTLPP